MAKLVLTYDTVTKSLDVAVDDKKLKGVTKAKFSLEKTKADGASEYENAKLAAYKASVKMEQSKAGVLTKHVMASTNTEKAKEVAKAGKSLTLDGVENIVFYTHASEEDNLVSEVTKWAKGKE